MADDDLITVCSECLQASCWQGIFMCQEARDADVVQKTRGELRLLNLEHSDYWKTDEELVSSPSPYDMRSVRKSKYIRIS